MLINELLDGLPVVDEGVAIRDLYHLGAYAITVAEAYDAAPELDPRAVPLWRAFMQQIEDTMLGKIARSGIRVVHTEQDPYSVATDDPRMMIRYMLWDMVAHGRLMIYSGHSDHPVFSPEQNVIFRTVHDYYAHSKLMATFKRQAAAMGLLGREPTPAELARLLPTINLNKGGNIGHTFSLRGELNAYTTHSKTAPPSTLPVLFTEIIGQASYQTVVGDFPAQKAAILPGFDYRRIGLGEHDAHPIQLRIDRLSAALRKDKTVNTSIAAKPVVQTAALLASLAH